MFYFTWGNLIQPGFDIATALSVCGAAWSFRRTAIMEGNRQAEEAKRQRHRTRAEFAVESLKGFLATSLQYRPDYYALGTEMWARMHELGEGEEDRAESHRLFLAHFEKMKLFLEGVRREIDDQIEIFFPVFATDHTAPESLIAWRAKLDEMLKALRTGDFNAKLDVMPKVTPLMNGVATLAAQELRKMLQVD